MIKKEAECKLCKQIHPNVFYCKDCSSNYCEQCLGTYLCKSDLLVEKKKINELVQFIMEYETIDLID